MDFNRTGLKSCILLWQGRWHTLYLKVITVRDSQWKFRKIHDNFLIYSFIFLRKKSVLQFVPWEKSRNSSVHILKTNKWSPGVFCCNWISRGFNCPYPRKLLISITFIFFSLLYFFLCLHMRYKRKSM